MEFCISRNTQSPLFCRGQYQGIIFRRIFILENWKKPRKYACGIIDWVSNSIAATGNRIRCRASRTRTVPVDVLEEQAAGLAVEGAVRPADLEEGTDGPPGTGPAVGTCPKHLWQGQAARARGVTPFHSVFVHEEPGRRSRESQTATLDSP